MPTTLAPTGPHYPSQLKLFTECRRRYQLKVVERRQVEEAFSAPLEKGKVAHAVLKYCADTLMRSPAHRPADLPSLVAARLPQEPYPSLLAWDADVAEVVRWISYALSYIGPNTTILGAELFLKRTYPGDDDSAAFAVGAVVDLVLLRHDDDSEPFLEVIDYKSGRIGWENRLAPVITRFVLRRLITQYIPTNKSPRVLYTELFLAERTPRHLEMELPLCLERWEEVKALVAEIGAEQVFPPSPSPLCRFCPYNGTACSAADEGQDDDQLW